MFQLAQPGFLHITMMPVTLAEKSGTNGREMAGKFGPKLASYF
jgi:hypothetical protein